MPPVRGATRGQPVRKSGPAGPLIGLFVPLVLLAGCLGPADGHTDGHGGNGHHAGNDDGNMAYTGEEDMLVTIVGGSPEEYRFDPERLTAMRGETVGVTFRNEGGIEHEFSIPDLAFHLHVPAGEEAQATFRATSTGTIGFGCYIPGHHDEGMKGTLVVEESG